jgi:predicted Rossmann fold nucleotide-binding protein DprA/Smf involved in DNA uptake
VDSGAIADNEKTVAVFGTGADVVYPKESGKLVGSIPFVRPGE